MFSKEYSFLKTLIFCALKTRCCIAYVTKLCLLSFSNQAFRRIKIIPEKGITDAAMFLLLPLPGKLYPSSLCQKLTYTLRCNLKCHFFQKFFPDTLCTPGGGNPDKLRTLIRKELCFIYLCIYSRWHCV